MSGKLTRNEWKGPTAEEKLEYQRRQNPARVAAHRAANKRKQQNIKELKRKDYIDRPENRDEYEMFINKFRKQQREVLKY